MKKLFRILYRPKVPPRKICSLKIDRTKLDFCQPFLIPTQSRWIFSRYKDKVAKSCHIQIMKCRCWKFVSPEIISVECTQKFIGFYYKFRDIDFVRTWKGKNNLLWQIAMRRRRESNKESISRQRISLNFEMILLFDLFVTLRVAVNKAQTLTYIAIFSILQGNLLWSSCRA